MMEEQQGVTPVQQKTHEPAIAALVCGILAWFLPIVGAKEMLSSVLSSED